MSNPPMKATMNRRTRNGRIEKLSCQGMLIEMECSLFMDLFSLAIRNYVVPNIRMI
jgi:hypothetical protein